MTYLIGIDGGGTKTVAILADSDGTIIASATAGPTNPNVVPKKDLQHTFETLLKRLETQEPDPYKKATLLFAGISGAGIKQSRTDLIHILTGLVSTRITVQVESDTINALYSGTFGEPGIVQIAGTGSITYGINNQSEHDRVGGWGYLFGDEGSGFDIGRQGIMSVLKSDDGRGEETILTTMLYTYFNVMEARALIQKIYTASSPKNEISPLSRIVFSAYKKGDLVASKIIDNVIGELSASILTLYRKLFDTQEVVKVVLCGGVFNEEDILPKLIKAELNDFKQISIHVPEMPPVGGSIIGSYLMQGSLPNINVVNNIITSFHSYNIKSR
ncbi:N-acetylglucosamine kinase-like BadF-type ATPase [Virgibacillus halotolerans]|uniref:N-acetylglucosamine kinase n=1 Tax=Virgibacillus halotolerans TaxID=1071053 RepID=UPI0019610663|nr:BadF/BadG/BcrA/BcrD ATPase family protein [Virgibacillus halotolerans]MBM7601907.1 N-acetylglucosamine kinase-like BadF-type ATPase [Virgibacillus halotolerans]